MSSKVIDILSGEPIEESTKKKSIEFEKVKEEAIRILTAMSKEIKNANENDKVAIFGMKISARVTSPFLVSLGGKADILEIIGGCELLKQSMLDHLMSEHERVDDGAS